MWSTPTGSMLSFSSLHSPRSLSFSFSSFCFQPPFSLSFLFFFFLFISCLCAPLSFLCDLLGHFVLFWKICAGRWKGGKTAVGSFFNVGRQSWHQRPMNAGNERESTAPKRRESRAGTRKVTSLTAEQLDRKRANDREAQRTIRQRTKEHIESLEREVAELRAKTERFDEVVQRNAALDEEVRRLRHQLAIVTSSPAYPGNGKQGRHECRGPYKLLHCQKFFSHLRTGSFFGISTNSPMQIATCPIWPCFPRTTPDPLEERQIPSPVPPQPFIHHTTRYPHRSSIGKTTVLPRRLRWASRPSQTTQAVSNRTSFTGSSSRP